MSRDYAVGVIIVALLLGAMFLLPRRPVAASSYAVSTMPQATSSNIRVVAHDAEPKRYQNKETRRIEYNGDGLPTLIEITRDYAIT
jgi:hypothetical protein